MYICEVIDVLISEYAFYKGVCVCVCVIERERGRERERERERESERERVCGGMCNRVANTCISYFFHTVSHTHVFLVL